MASARAYWDRLPLIGRVLSTASVALLVAGAAMLFGSARQEAAEIRADLRTELARELEILPTTLAETAIIGDFATLQQTLDRYVARPLIAAADFRDVGGTLLLSRAGKIPNLAPSWFITLFEFHEVSGTAQVSVGGRSYGELKLTLTATGLANRAWSRLKGHLAILLLAISLDFVGIWLVLRSGLAPLKQIETGADQLAAGKLDVALVPTGSTELRSVIGSFNRMARAVREAQEAVRESAASLQDKTRELATILDHSSVGIAFVRDARPMWANRRMGEMFGYTAEQMKGQTIGMFYVSPEAFKTFQAQADPLLARGQRYTLEEQMLHRDGHRVWMRMSARAISPGNPLSGSIWVFEDISQQKQTEAALQRAKEAADAANLAKSQFLATMSHEIRTPMNGVLGMAQLLMDADVVADERIDYARTIYHSGQTLLTILNDILDLSKVEAGKVEIERLIFTPPQLLREVEALFAEMARGKGIALEATWLGDEARRFRGDPTRLRQVLANLVSNAIKFTAGGRVHIRAEEAGLCDGEALLCFYVDDNGIGIAAERKHRLFQPFSQLDSTITRRFGGTGLGLAIAHGLVRLMGGNIGVESTEGLGATFWFTVRVQAVADNSRGESRPLAVAGAPATASPAGLRILVVEDVAVNRQVVGLMLGKLGYEVGTATNGREAVDVMTAGEQHYDLILMDCQMPEMDGFEATRRIRVWERETGRPPLPIVALTAGAFKDDEENCLAAGMSAYLPKPVDMTKLRTTLGEKLLSQRTAAIPL